jgi:multiple antibiotic resistance protein
MEIVEFALVAITSSIAVMNPTSTVAIYTTLTGDMKPEERLKLAGKAMKISFIVLAFFAFTGQLLFSVFNFTVAAFKIAGGILLITAALKMLNPRRNEFSQEELENIAIVPLAFPLTAGPGTITTTILLASEASSLLATFLVFVAIIVGIMVSYLGMRYSPKILKLLGDEGLRVVTKLMAIIVLAIAVQFVISGIAEAIPQVLPT